ncbi:sulfite exporter TauE/SafE family protein [Paraoerskovia marina]|uniref:sulfite exporter TauE/SafE family protein n=1 Tax=Paraoerskovia marina TaxID=545619 RepID=UPI000492E41C|nr:sulfite exporter TauE/SafE family protein [Paraoerskovia marina]
MDLAASTVALALAAVTLSTFIQFATGSGFGILGGPLLLMIDPGLVPGPLLLLTVVVMLAVVWTERRGLRHVDLGWAALGAVPAGIGALWLVRLMDERVTEIVVGVAIAVGVIAGLAGWKVRQTRPALVVAGVLGGALSTIAATPGPPVVVVYRTADVSRYRANLSLFFVATSVVSLSTLIVSGELDSTDVTAAAWLLPAVVLGALVAHFLVRLIPPRSIRPAALAMCLISAVSLIVSALAG